MESLFPGLFFLSYFVPVVLRVGAAVVFALIAQHLYRVRGEFSTTEFPIIGKPGMIAVWIKILAAWVIAFLLAIGLFTQAVALVGVVASIKYAWFVKKHPSLFPHGKVAYLLLALICLSLVATGPGAFAVDLPY